MEECKSISTSKLLRQVSVFTMELHLYISCLHPLTADLKQTGFSNTEETYSDCSIHYIGKYSQLDTILIFFKKINETVNTSKYVFKLCKVLCQTVQLAAMC